MVFLSSLPLRRWSAPALALAMAGLGFACADPGATGESTDAVHARASRPFRAAGRRIVDDHGRAVLLRGVNLAGNSKRPPFVPYDDPKALDVLQSLGMNVIRMPFIWEAYESERGRYDETYLAKMVDVATDASARGIHTIVDFHQDAFSRYALGGCGSGFPAWVVAPSLAHATPDNSASHCSDWGAQLFNFTKGTTRDMHAAWSKFYANESDVRNSFLYMTARVAERFSAVEGVIGYDLLNEPFGNDDELSALYRDEANVIREQDPDAILFVEGQISTNTGLPFSTRLPKPAFENFVYAPHYYDPVTMTRHAYDGNPFGIDSAFRTHEGFASAWNVPLFLGEYGAFATTDHVTAYVVREYEDLDAYFAGGTQWNLSPRWNAADKDGWNGEDLHIVDAQSGAFRANFKPRPFPRLTAGIPGVFSYRETSNGGAFEYRWSHQPQTGATEIVMPTMLFPEHTEIVATGVACSRRGVILSCSGGVAGEAVVHGAFAWQPPR